MWLFTSLVKTFISILISWLSGGQLRFFVLKWTRMCQISQMKYHMYSDELIYLWFYFCALHLTNLTNSNYSSLKRAAYPNSFKAEWNFISWEVNPCNPSWDVSDAGGWLDLDLSCMKWNNLVVFLRHKNMRSRLGHFCANFQVIWLDYFDWKPYIFHQSWH